VYDAGGALAAEYSVNAPTPTATPTTSYMTTDHLGSPRVITDKNGAVISRRDFMPFGEEIYAGVGGRNTTQKYANFGSDNIRKRYTGYEKDDETQLDFAEARMYQNKHGRFTAVDPLMASASPINPQTFNRYSYTGNNPINYTDPSGLKYCQASGGSGFDWRDGACKSGETELSETPIEITRSGCTSNNKCFDKGSLVILHGNGSVTVIKKPTDAQKAIAQGKVVTNETVNVQNESATEVVTTDSGTVGNIITPQPLLQYPNFGERKDSGFSPGTPEDNSSNVIPTVLDGVKSVSDEILDTVYNIAPDSCGFGCSAPLLGGGGFSVSKDFGIFGTVDKTTPESTSLRGGCQVGCTYFVPSPFGSMQRPDLVNFTPKQRDDILEGPDWNFSGGWATYSHSLDEGEPDSVTLGGPFTLGTGASYTRKKLAQLNSPVKMIVEGSIFPKK
jgi:RHS repeat-associated protein